MEDIGLKKITPTKKPKGGRREKIIVDELLTRQVASLLSLGRSIPQIAEEVGVSYPIVKRIMGMDATKALVKEVGESSIAAAKAQIRMHTSRMVDKIMDVIHKNLEEGNLDAVKVGLKILGFQDQEQVGNTAQTLQVIMPGGSLPEKLAIEVDNEDN